MKIILIRHATRERDPALKSDEPLPLKPEGKQEARELREKLPGLGLKPTVYFTSRYKHARETAEILGDQAGGISASAVVAMETLTPHQEYTFEKIIVEAAQEGHDLSKLDQVAFVLHHPRLNQLVARLTSQPESPMEPEYAGGVCLTADSLADFINGQGKEDCTF